MISAWAKPELTNGSTSVGIVFKRDKLGSIMQVKRIVGKLLESFNNESRNYFLLIF
jgi:hypothetical protein